MECEGRQYEMRENCECECEIRLLTSVTARCYDKVSKECLTCDCLSVCLSVLANCPNSPDCPDCSVCRCLSLSCLLASPRGELMLFAWIFFHIAAFYASVLNARYRYTYGIFFFIYIYVHILAATFHTFCLPLQKGAECSPHPVFSFLPPALSEMYL